MVYFFTTNCMRMIPSYQLQIFAITELLYNYLFLNLRLIQKVSLNNKIIIINV